MECDISVVIPCLNEKKTIAEVITSVSQELQKSGFRYEIIVVDNGSTDESVDIAKSLKVEVILSTARTVAGVRNMGVDVACGKLLIFLDADVVVQPSWGKNLKVICEDIATFDNMITGSNCSVPDNAKPMLASWYKGISTDTRDTHLGTGHMIVSANIFRRLGGFDKQLSSGEDYDFCMRAKKLGVSVISNPLLRAFHYGYPANIWGFAKREIWHGEGDCRSWKSVFSSSVAICGITFVLLNVLAVISVFISIKLLWVLLVTLGVITLSVNLYKFGVGEIRDFFYRCVVTYVYLFSRGLSLPYYIFKRKYF